MNRRVWLPGVIAGLSLGVMAGANGQLHQRTAFGRHGGASASSPVVPARTPAEFGDSARPRADTTTSVPEPPDTLATPRDTVPPPPGPNYVWVEGRWVWHANKQKYEWEPGFWRPAPPVYLAAARATGTRS